MMRTKLTIMHFDSAEDLLHGIDALQHYSVSICEVYTPVHIPGIETKLRVQHIRLGYAALKFGCLGGTAITTLAYYMFEQHSLIKASEKSAFALLFTALVMLVTYFLTTRLFPGRAPRVIGLGPNDNRYLIIIDAKSITPHEGITHLFKYAGAVEISSAIKNIVIS